MFASKRLSKELLKIQGSLPPGITLVSAPDLKEWQMDIRVLDSNPIYANATYRLRFRFSNKYPIEPPEVMFITCTAASTSSSSSPSLSPSPSPSPRSIPMHPHVYSNGIICLDLLGTAGWSPVQNVESICMSLQSMLTGNTKNERPPGDAQFVKGNRLRPRDIPFDYDDGSV